jgi:hypothetical protein
MLLVEAGRVKACAMPREAMVRRADENFMVAIVVVVLLLLLLFVGGVGEIMCIVE